MTSPAIKGFPPAEPAPHAPYTHNSFHAPPIRLHTLITRVASPTFRGPAASAPTWSEPCHVGHTGGAGCNCAPPSGKWLTLRAPPRERSEKGRQADSLALMMPQELELEQHNVGDTAHAPEANNEEQEEEEGVGAAASDAVANLSGTGDAPSGGQQVVRLPRRCCRINSLGRCPAMIPCDAPVAVPRRQVAPRPHTSRLAHRRPHSPRHTHDFGVRRLAGGQAPHIQRGGRLRHWQGAGPQPRGALRRRRRGILASRRARGPCVRSPCPPGAPYLTPAARTSQTARAAPLQAGQTIEQIQKNSGARVQLSRAGEFYPSEWGALTGLNGETTSSCNVNRSKHVCVIRDHGHLLAQAAATSTPAPRAVPAEPLTGRALRARPAEQAPPSACCCCPGRCTLSSRPYSSCWRSCRGSRPAQYRAAAAAAAGGGRTRCGTARAPRLRQRAGTHTARGALPHGVAALPHAQNALYCSPAPTAVRPALSASSACRLAQAPSFIFARHSAADRSRWRFRGSCAVR
jgi:hypothetical protein